MKYLPEALFHFSAHFTSLDPGSTAARLEKQVGQGREASSHRNGVLRCQEGLTLKVYSFLGEYFHCYVVTKAGDYINSRVEGFRFRRVGQL